jgi:hypothetical protein
VSFPWFVQRKREVHLCTAQQSWLILLHDPQQMAFYFGDASAQVRLQHEFRTLELHFEDVRVETIISVLLLTLSLLLQLFVLFADHLWDCEHELLLVGEEFGWHFFIVQ